MQEALVNDNMALVYHICSKHFDKYYTSNLHEYEDLVGVGMVGLVKAANHFEPERGYKFSTLAYPSILNELRRYIRDSNPVGGIKTPRDKIYKFTCNSFHAPVGEGMTFEDYMEAEQDFTSAEVKEFLATLQGRELETCKLKIAGYTQKQIARRLGVSQPQVSRYMENIRAKHRAYAKGGQHVAVSAV